MIVVIQTLVYFRESLFGVIKKLLGPYIKSFRLSLRSNCSSDDESSDEQAFAEYDEEKGVVFFPPVYAQRYAAVVDCLMDNRWCGSLEKVADLGYHDVSFIKYLLDVPGVTSILGVDLDAVPLRCSSELLAGNTLIENDKELQIMLLQGNAADPDYRLIGCDAVVAIEVVEHMLPADLERLVHTIFGFIKPWIVIITTPNSDFNVLFKALESNGLRRLDHFFEWSQEQFHDWCSNIVVRYPQYLVSCKGVGPGPEGTEHLGCCSQLALFVAQDYHKQRDLHLNSLALVTETISDAPDSEMEFNTSESVMDMSSEMKSYDSVTELCSSQPSCVTFVVTSPSYYTLESTAYVDNILQCNIDTEVGKGYLMFENEDLCVNVLKPRRQMCNKMYLIGDITCRLNCSTSHIKKFSKTTLELMTKNKVDLCTHTKNVVDKVNELTKMLNLDRSTITEEGEWIWNNIYWGYDAPYWNQYYKVIKVYRYPFEEKSEDQRILDTLFMEIHKIIDSGWSSKHHLDSRVEIPMQHLLALVEHITDDGAKVRELLEWNGYEIQGDMLVHKRTVLADSISDCSAHTVGYVNRALTDTAP